MTDGTEALCRSFDYAWSLSEEAQLNSMRALHLNDKKKNES